MTAAKPKTGYIVVSDTHDCDYGEMDKRYFVPGAVKSAEAYLESLQLETGRWLIQQLKGLVRYVRVPPDFKLEAKTPCFLFDPHIPATGDWVDQRLTGPYSFGDAKAKLDKHNAQFQGRGRDMQIWLDAATFAGLPAVENTAKEFVLVTVAPEKKLNQYEHWGYNSMAFAQETLTNLKREAWTDDQVLDWFENVDCQGSWIPDHYIEEVDMYA